MPTTSPRLSIRPRRHGHVVRACAALAAYLFATIGTAATFNVNSPADFADAAPGDGICETAPGNGVCTLRAAVMEASALPGADTIELQPNVTYLLTSTAAGQAGHSLQVNDSVSIVGAGPGSSVVDGNPAITDLYFSVFTVANCVGGGFTCDDAHPGIVASFSGLTITNGDAVTGGAITMGSAHVAVSNCALVNNHAGKYGGALYGGVVTIDQCTISGNSTAASPGGGGGIYGGTVTLRNSTVSGNSAVTGGGIYAGSALAVVNSTISGNSATGYGGGIYTGTTTNLYNATVADNQANSDYEVGGQSGGGVYVVAGSQFTFASSIIAGNVADYAGVPNAIIVPDDCNGTLTSQGNDIVGTSANCTIVGSVQIVDPLLGPLQDNGGPTLTHALLPGSPAIDAGNAFGCTDNVGAFIVTDQRGVARPQGPRCDIGAFESNDAIFADGFDP